MDSRPTRAFLFALLLCSAGCRTDVGEAPSENRARVLEAPPQPLTTEKTPNNEGSVDTRLQPAIESAKQDLAAMLNAKPETINVIEARYVTWADSSLGCPRPDLEYMQVLTPGILVVLRHGGSSYQYHGSRDGLPIHCERPQQPVDGDAGEATH